MKLKLNVKSVSPIKYISQMEWTPFKSLFWKTNGSVGKLMIFVTSGLSLWNRSFY